MRIIIYWHIFYSSGFHHICNIKCRLDCRYSPQNIFNAKNFDPHKKPISLLNVPICTQGMQRTWWPEAGTIIVTGPYCLKNFSVMLQLYMNMIQDQPVQITFIYNLKEPPEARKPLVILEPISGTLFFHILKPTVQLVHSKSSAQHYSSIRKRTYQIEFRPTWIVSMLVCLNVSADQYNMNEH